jgi:hypothetical protein
MSCTPTNTLPTHHNTTLNAYSYVRPKSSTGGGFKITNNKTLRNFKMVTS